MEINATLNVLKQQLEVFKEILHLTNGMEPCWPPIEELHKENHSSSSDASLNSTGDDVFSWFTICLYSSGYIVYRRHRSIDP